MGIHKTSLFSLHCHLIFVSLILGGEKKTEIWLSLSLPSYYFPILQSNLDDFISIIISQSFIFLAILIFIALVQGVIIFV